MSGFYSFNELGELTIARYGGFRFGIYAFYGHSDIASLVVGLKVSDVER